MLQHVNTVLVGKFPATYTTVDALNVGEIAMFNQDGQLITNAAGVTAAKEVAFGLVESKVEVSMPNGTVANKNSIKFSKNIDRSRIKTPSLTVVPFKAAVEDSYSIDFTNVITTDETRYVVRFIYRDLSEHKFQVTKSYEAFVAAGATPAQIAGMIVRSINRDSERRINASVDATGKIITVVAKIVNDNEGINSINNYSQVNMEVFVHGTNPRRGFLSTRQFVPAGLIVTKLTNSDPGTGNPKIIRDREQAALSYRGITNRTIFPVNKPDVHVDLNKTYSTLVIEWDAIYRSPDNQYLKDTPLTVEVYGEGATAQVHQAMITAIKA